MIDWKNKPEGAQRYSNELFCPWLKNMDGVILFYNGVKWSTYTKGSSGLRHWDAAAIEPTEQPPLQLTWKDAPAKATHILQHCVSSKQEFARNDNDKILVNVDEDDLFYNVDKWFIVSEAPTSEIYYVAGPMTGYVNYNRDMFNAATKALTSEGHAVLNPATLPEGLTQSQYMDICLAMLRCATRIKMLKGWEKSEGARIEHAMAIKSSIVVEY